MAAWVQLGLRLRPARHRELRSLARKQEKPLTRYITEILKAHLEKDGKK